jgi:hypothetical protein
MRCFADAVFATKSPHSLLAAALWPLPADISCNLAGDILPVDARNVKAFLEQKSQEASAKTNSAFDLASWFLHL